MGALVIPLNARRIAEIVGGELLGLDPQQDGPVIEHVTTDSREAGEATLFVAKPGEVTDGHRFVAAAFAAGFGARLRTSRSTICSGHTVERKSPTERASLSLTSE